jgi:hypothetical protein
MQKFYYSSWDRSKHFFRTAPCPLVINICVPSASTLAIKGSEILLKKEKKGEEKKKT